MEMRRPQHRSLVPLLLALAVLPVTAGCQSKVSAMNCANEVVVESRPESGSIEIASPEQAGSSVPLLVELTDGHVYRVVRHDGTPETYATGAGVRICTVSSHVYKSSFYGLRLDEGTSPGRFYNAYRVR